MQGFDVFFYYPFEQAVDLEANFGVTVMAVGPRLDRSHISAPTWALRARNMFCDRALMRISYGNTKTHFLS